MRLLVLAVLVGCYAPRAPQGVPCVDDDHCPTPQRCAADGFCSLFDAAPDVAPDVTQVERFVPSNGIAAARTDAVTVEIAFPAGISTLDTATGAITGALTRAPGTGVLAGIDFALVGSLAVFSFRALSVPAGATLHFTGANAVVLLVGTVATIDGVVDGSGSCYGTDPACAGPGGGRGGRDPATPPTGCGPGGIGEVVVAANNADSGGGGGGGGGPGGAGGTASQAIGGTAGSACLAMDLQPLAGGSGGGISPKGAALAYGRGGGGGGALQLTALDSVTVGGTIRMGGAGGQGAQPNTGADAGGGSGGGAGGGILVEGPAVMLGTQAILAANGGGGGGGGAGNNGGQPGQDGAASPTPAAGGAGANPPEAGGAGGARTAAVAGSTATPNAGGGGGGPGRIVLRSKNAPSGGTLSPLPVLVAVP